MPADRAEGGDVLEPSQLVASPDKTDLVRPAEYILESEICTIGRSATCNVVVGGSTISRLHAKIERDGPYYILHDTNSANGTFVNGRRIRGSYLLKDDDAIGLSAPTPVLFFEDVDPTIYLSGQLRYDESTMTFYLKQKPVELTPMQFKLLYHLYQYAGDVCTRESCAEAIWGREYEPGLDADALDRAVSGLRGKLRQLDPEAELIETRRGLGYVLQW